MRTNKQNWSIVLAAAMLITVVLPTWLLAQSPEAMSSSRNQKSSVAQWSLQVDKVDPGDLNVAPSFQIAIYESLLDELSKTKRFKQVLRSLPSNDQYHHGGHIIGPGKRHLDQ